MHLKYELNIIVEEIVTKKLPPVQHYSDSVRDLNLR